jgi:putative methionine-R-sulfoxide reductase with GAF domain
MSDQPRGEEWPAHEQLRRIEAVTDVALALLGVEELLAQLLERVQQLLAVDTVAVLLMDPAGETLVATAARGIEAEVHQGVRIPLGRGFAGRIAAEKAPVILPSVDATTVSNPILWQRGIQSLLGVPLLGQRGVLGVLHVGTVTTRRFTRSDVRLLELVAGRVAAAIDVRNAQADRDAAALLQRSLLPTRLPHIPGVELAARYVPSEGDELGGDWYDVFVLPDGAWCITIGDVVGHGFAAAEAMGRLRTALRSHALYSTDAAETLSRLDQQIRHFDGPAMLATVQVAILDPSLQQIQLCSAGHPPPVLSAPGQPAQPLDILIDPPIGVPCEQRRTTTLDLPHDAVLCFYTDGLVERHDIPLEQNLQRLCQATAAKGTAEHVCHAIMSNLIGNTPPGDDTAVLVLHRVPVRPSHGSGPPPAHPHEDEHRPTRRPSRRTATPDAARKNPARTTRRGDRTDPRDHSRGGRPARHVREENGTALASVGDY